MVQVRSWPCRLITTRDHAFAKQHNLEIKQVIRPSSGDDVDLPFTEPGTLVHSGEFDGLSPKKPKPLHTSQLKRAWHSKSDLSVRDWLFLRRYWEDQYL